MNTAGDEPHREFVGEPIVPDVAAMDLQIVAGGQPAAPLSFRWRDEDCQTARVEAVWRDISDGKHGGEPGYVRKHWFRLRLTNNWVAEVYFLRQPQGRGKPRWFLYTLQR